MYIQVENPRTNVESVPNRKRQTESENSHWYFVRQKLLMFKHGESHPDKANLMLTIAASQKEADDVIPFKEGFYVLDDDAFIKLRLARTVNLNSLVISQNFV